ncbi:MAG TPA: TrmH family RNA methyltransferase [Methanosarcina sp.]|nr:TrmH family RNA methyltransferase [Methanosarcina sp.]
MTDFFDQSWNVQDEFKGMSVESIRKSLAPKRLPFISVFENVNGDFNKSSAVRNHNGFCGQEIWFVGNKKWDKRGAVGTHHYENIRYFSSWREVAETRLADDISEYEWVAIDNIEGAEPLDKFLWSEKTIMIYGEEQRGLSDEAITLCDRIVYIPMRGSVRSLNVATASGIVMYDYVYGVEE